MNIFDLPQLPLSDEFSEFLVKNDYVSIERIISCGNSTDWFDQTLNEFVILLQGCAVIEYENGDKIDMAKGDTLFLPAHITHRVAFSSENPPCIWICVFW